MSEASRAANAITLWTYPIGAWGRMARIKPLLDAFTQATGIEVRVEFLSYENGDKRIHAVLGTEDAPDLVMEGPERLVADWGVSGAMADLRDMIEPVDRTELYRSVLSACTAPDGAVYEYPLVRTVHCMAINVDAFRAANALQYVDLKKHTWTTEQFHLAVSALYAHYGDAVGVVYCGGQGGDQGTRALITNLYDGPFTDPDRTRYTWDDPRILKALDDLCNMEGIYFDPYLTGGDEIQMFYQGRLKMAFCWNIAKHLRPDLTNMDVDIGKTIDGEEITFMAFPSPRGAAKLYSGIWGFGVFRHEDPGRTAAAKAFIRFICDSEHTREAVQTAGYFAARTAIDGHPISNVWSVNKLMQEYCTVLPYIEENNQLMKGWRTARAAWWTMLQKIAAGGDIGRLVSRYVTEANLSAQ